MSPSLVALAAVLVVNGCRSGFAPSGGFDVGADLSDLGSSEAGCQPGATRCDGDRLLTCTADGAETSSNCLLGCAAAWPAACRLPAPSNGVDPDLVTATSPAWKPQADATIDTTTGTIGDLSGGQVSFTVVSQSGAGELGVFAFESVQIPAGVTVTASGSRALVLLARSITIDGVVDVGARGSKAGPGGFAGSNSSSPGGGPGGGASGTTDNSTNKDGGGGGGGYGTAGGDGGQALGGGGGAASGAEALVPLRGGGGGGSGAPGQGTVQATGGGGGGALQLVALEAISISGTVAGGGGGGTPGNPVAADGGAGAGGGSGGAILLEAPSVTLSQQALLAVNGGGGGGSPKFADTGTAGADGGGSTAAAAGGAGAQDEGSGGAGSVTISAGQDGTDGANNGGGGGGGAGRIRTNVVQLSQGGTISGAFSVGVLQARP